MFENYTASFEIDTQRIELSLWDTSGKLWPSSPLFFMLTFGRMSLQTLRHLSTRCSNPALTPPDRQTAQIGDGQMGVQKLFDCVCAPFPQKYQSSLVLRGSGMPFLNNGINL